VTVGVTVVESHWNNVVPFCQVRCCVIWTIRVMAG